MPWDNYPHIPTIICVYVFYMKLLLISTKSKGELIVLLELLLIDC